MGSQASKAKKSWPSGNGFVPRLADSSQGTRLYVPLCALDRLWNSFCAEEIEGASAGQSGRVQNKAALQLRDTPWVPALRVACLLSHLLNADEMPVLVLSIKRYDAIIHSKLPGALVTYGYRKCPSNVLPHLVLCPIPWRLTQTSIVLSCGLPRHRDRLLSSTASTTRQLSLVSSTVSA